MQLSSSVDLTPPEIKEVIPSANALLQQLTQVEVVFSEDVAGVDAADLLVNGQPSTGVTAFNGSQYLFEFSQPASGTSDDLGWSTDCCHSRFVLGGESIRRRVWRYTLDPNAASTRSYPFRVYGR